MTFEYAVCPHCGCQCEDDEYCAACGKLFNEGVTTRNVSFLGLLGSGLQNVFKKREHHSSFTDNIEDDPDFDPSYSFFSTNIYNDDH